MSGRLASLSRRQIARVGFVGFILALIAAPTFARDVSLKPAGSVPDAAQVQQRMLGLAVPFEANTGQEDQRVAFIARTFGGTLFITRDGVLVHSVPGRPVAEQDERKGTHKRGPGWVLTESLVDAHPVVRGEAPSATRVSRFIGSDPKRWQTSVPTFDRVALGEAWPGIEVELAARGNNVEKLFTVAPGADVRRIAIQLRGANRLELAADGALVVHTGNGKVSFTTPRAWQDINGERKPVRVTYTLSGSRYGFHLLDYNPAYPVVIDPLLQATYLGGGGSDFVNAIALDANRDVYAVGTTASTVFPAPGMTGLQATYDGGAGDAFVVKLNNGLTPTIIQATYFGGNGDDIANAIALGPSGDVFVAGSTDSTTFPYPFLGAYAGYQGGGADAFVAKLSSDLTTLIDATYLGGSGYDHASAIALHAGGNVFVTGVTNSATFPKTPGGAQSVYGGVQESFVARLNNGLTTLIQATYLNSIARAIALDASGNVFVAGDQPLLVAKLNNGLTAYMQVTNLGPGWGGGIALDASGNVFVAGTTPGFSPGPTAGAAQPSYGGGLFDAFVMKLSNSLNVRIRTTYLGGLDGDFATAIALDTDGNVFVAGYTHSTNFPGTVGGAQAVHGGGSNDAFVARLDNGLTSLTQATYLGGSGYDQGLAIALNPTNNNVFVAGWTASSTNFPDTAPGTVGGAQASFGGGPRDGFVARLTRGLHDLANSVGIDDGDPHITTVSGLHYNFQSAGEFTALRDGPGMVIQTRQSPTSTFGPYWDSYTGLTTCVSVNTALAARVGKHRVTYQPNFKNAADQSGLQLRVDGVLAPLTPAGLNLSGGGRVVQTAGALEIDFPDGTVLIATPTWAAPQWFLNIGVYRTEAREGIMGWVPQGSWLPALPNGTSVGTMPADLDQRFVTLNQTYADAWRVNSETSLFDYARGTSTATFTFRDWPAESGSCVVRNNPPPAKPIELSRAREICRLVAGKTSNADCVFDVAATGVPAFAKAYLLAQRIREGATTTTVSKEPTKGAEAVKFTATVTRTALDGAGVPTGTVQFILDGRKVGRPVSLDAKGQATWKAARLKRGKHQVTASYRPKQGSVFLPSSSLHEEHTVGGAARSRRPD